MNALDWPLLADENIHPDVVRALVERGKDVRSVRDHAVGLSDREILRLAHRGGRVVLTHDADFGALTMLEGEPYLGVVYLRPGHFSAIFVLEILASIEASRVDMEPPFLLVAERRGDRVRIRVRRR